ncbi:HTTM domain-containing protein [Marinobacter hydrocarbonoclasticus]|nr:HTTM domain-containing protein [Marinobacter nauticus]
MSTLTDRAFKPISIASLVVFRIAFGLTMLVEVGRFFWFGWINSYYLSPPFLFKYFGFEWVSVWPGDGLYWHFGLMGLAALGIALGCFYRLSATLFLVLFSYVFLLDQTHYLNHFYFVILLNALLCVVPAHRYWSLDALRRPQWASPVVPAWGRIALLLQMEVMYLYAGLVKLNSDWLSLQPMQGWFATQVNQYGPWIAEPWVAAMAAYGTIALHLFGAPLLLFKRTRLGVFIVYAGFHLLNHLQFSIGIFPWLTLAGTTLFFEPDWPQRLWAKVRGKTWITSAAPAPASGFIASRYPVAVVTLLGLWMAAQVLIPLRHYLYPGDPSWTEEGHRFAWRMKLRAKSGIIDFVLTEPESGRRWRVDPLDTLTPRQLRKMTCRPDMILQFAHHLADQTEAAGQPRPSVSARVKCTLNGRPYQTLIDPKVDLAMEPRTLRTAHWIVPLSLPLNPLKEANPHAQAR